MTITPKWAVVLGAVGCLTLGTLIGAARPWSYFATGPATKEANPRVKARGDRIDIGEEREEAKRAGDHTVSVLQEELATAKQQLWEAKLAQAERKLEEELDSAKDNKDARRKAIDRFKRKAREVRDELIIWGPPGLFQAR